MRRAIIWLRGRRKEKERRRGERHLPDGSQDIEGKATIGGFSNHTDPASRSPANNGSGHKVSVSHGYWPRPVPGACHRKVTGHVTRSVTILDFTGDEQYHS